MNSIPWKCDLHSSDCIQYVHFLVVRFSSEVSTIRSATSAEPTFHGQYLEGRVLMVSLEFGRNTFPLPRIRLNLHDALVGVGRGRG